MQLVSWWKSAASTPFVGISGHCWFGVVSNANFSLSGSGNAPSNLAVFGCLDAKDWSRDTTSGGNAPAEDEPEVETTAWSEEGKFGASLAGSSWPPLLLLDRLDLAVQYDSMTSERLRLIDQPGLQSQPVMNTYRQRVMSREKSNRSSATKTLTSGKWGLQAQSFDKLAQPRPLSSEPPMPRRWMSSSGGTGRGSHQSKQRTTAPRVPTVGTLGSQAMRKSCSSSPYTKKKKYIYIDIIYTHIILQRWLDHQVVRFSRLNLHPEATFQATVGNAEIQNIIQILGHLVILMEEIRRTSWGW